MANSSQSGNILGYASGTQPGLVSTVAQIFAGKKTLDGGAAIKGDTSGVAIAAGYVGEKLDFTSRTQAGGAGTWSANTTALVTLTAGIWLICGNAALSITGTSQAAAISTSSTNGSGIISQFVGTQNASLNVQGAMPLVYYSVSFGSTQSLYLQVLNASGTASATVTGFAVRIA